VEINMEVPQKIKKQVGCQWLTPVILAIQGGRIRRIPIRRKLVQSQLGQIFQETLSQKKSITRKGWQGGSRYRP
jgi:hypothetical protein